MLLNIHSWRLYREKSGVDVSTVKVQERDKRGSVQLNEEGEWLFRNTDGFSL